MQRSVGSFLIGRNNHKMATKNANSGAGSEESLGQTVEVVIRRVSEFFFGAATATTIDLTAEVEGESDEEEKDEREEETLKKPKAKTYVPTSNVPVKRFRLAPTGRLNTRPVTIFECSIPFKINKINLRK